VTVCLFASPVLAGTKAVVNFDVPAQPAQSGIVRFAQQANIQVLITSPDTAGVTVGPIKGAFTVEAALRNLVARSHLHLVSFDGRTAVLARSGEQTVTHPPELHTAAMVRMMPQAVAAPTPPPAAPAPEAPPNADIVVTGSRVITSGINAPTPLTTVTTAQLSQTTPSNVADALNKLPQFALSNNQRNIGNSSANTLGNFLNLRGFGAIRTLILMDGMRVPPTAANGTVDVNTLPQLLMERVDVVTGGASAVYGSDAVTGVVNFVLDHKFKGIKALAQGGVSSYGDDASYRIGVAAGGFLMDDKLHIEASVDHYYSGGIGDKLDRPYGALSVTTSGSGTAANPFRLNPNTRTTLTTPGGFFHVACNPAAGPGALCGDFTFPSNGVIAPFTHGLPSGSTGSESGGDGGFGNSAPRGSPANTSLIAKLKSDQVFGRADYEFSPALHMFAQGSYVESVNYASFFPQGFSLTVLADNPYLPADVRAGLAANGTSSFTFMKQFIARQGSGQEGHTRNITGTIGLDGKLIGDFKWNAYYTYSNSRLFELNPGNVNQQLLLASLDAVAAPAGVPGVTPGQIVCRVSTTAAGRAAYPGCLPVNPFGPTSETDGAFNYFDKPSYFTLTNKLDDFAASLSGTAFNDWAGPVRVSVSGEHRRFSMNIDSQFLPTAKVDCTLLNPLMCPGLNSSGAPTTTPPALWQLNVVAPVYAKENVSEVAGEIAVPLLRDKPFFRSLDFNGAVRYTHYSVSGNATTWKLGLTWDVSSELKFRGTRSRDIRAPTLQDLFNPIQAGISGYQDVLTGQSVPTMIVQTQGNAKLVPEVANTITAGLIYRPHWLRGASLAVDWYQIKIDNAIVTLSGTDPTVQNQCISSGGTSPFCSFFVGRPGPVTDTSPTNLPTTVLSQPFNVAKTMTTGVDVEGNYRTRVPSILPGTGTLDLRALVSYQPKLTQQTLPGAVVTNAAGAQGLAAWRINAAVNYQTGRLRTGLVERWHSSERQNADPTLVFTQGDIPAIGYTDLSIDYALGGTDASNAPLSLFLSVENLFNKQPFLQIRTGLAASPNFAYPAPLDQDVIGRYFTMGVRARF
jgi:outer membrane receptor protein involved in Fe transport